MRGGALMLTFFPLLEGGGLYERLGGGIIEDLKYFNLKNNDRRTNTTNSCYNEPHWVCNLVSLPV